MSPGSTPKHEDFAPFPQGHRVGEPGYKRATLGMLAAGLATFNAIYSTQALLPTLVNHFGVSPTLSAWTLSATTGILALMIVPASILSERFGRGPVLKTTVTVSTLIAMLLPLAPNIETLIIMRAIQGVVLAGGPAVAMAWLSEEIHPHHLGRAMGVYIAGNTVGGLLGRLIPAGMLELADWRFALLTSSAFALANAVVLVFLLPRQRRFIPKELHFSFESRTIFEHLKNPQLAGLFMLSFLGMGTFVSVYNFYGFRLVLHFGLPASLVGVLALMYLSGTWSSAQAGALMERYGRPLVIVLSAALMLVGLVLIIPGLLVLNLAGLFVFTASFFALHSTASSWVGLIATTNRAEASSMYLLSYYMGSSIIGGLSGLAFSALNWAGFVLILAVLIGFLLIDATFIGRRTAR